MTRTRTTRRGVTLVEMLVATAMCIVGMWLLTWMFQQATASFSIANAQINLTSQERLVTTVMTRDLQAWRFLEDEKLPNRGQKLSDLPSNNTVPKTGYFFAQSVPVLPTTPPLPPYNPNPYIFNPGPWSMNALENGGNPDSYGFFSSRSTNHFLAFTAVLPDVPNSRFLAEVPAGSGSTQAGTAAEITYFLSPSVTSPGGVQLYDLIRVQRVVALGPYDQKDYQKVVAAAYAGGDTVNEVMVSAPPGTGAIPPPAQMYKMSDLAAAFGVNSPRFGSSMLSPANGQTLNPLAARTPASKRYGEDRLMANVVSFEVKYTGSGSYTDASGNTQSWPMQFAAGNSDFPYDFIRNAPYYQFDTGNSSRQISITGIQIKIRALNGTNARQTTITLAL
jgi:hypothetical protein